jgi:hypothetical protein
MGPHVTICPSTRGPLSPRFFFSFAAGGLRFQGERVDSGHTLAVWRAADLTLLVTSLLSGADIEEHVKLLRAHAAQGAQCNCSP